MAGDKYQVYNMSHSIFAFIKNILSTSNCCIIYDQLIKFPTEYIGPLDQVKKLIRCNSESAFKNKYFVNISQETLVDLLSMDGLTMEEIGVLHACAKWVDEEIKRLNLKLNRTNKQMVFKPIKNFIRFSEITLDELRNFDQIKDLLSSDELSSLFLHHLNISKFALVCNTTRKRLELRSAYCNKQNKNTLHSIQQYRDAQHYNTQMNFSELSFVFKASKHINIINIGTFLPTKIQGLELSIYDVARGLKLELNYETLHSSSDNLLSIHLIDSVPILSAKDYRFVFKFQSNTIVNSQLSRDTKLISEGKDEPLVCNVTSQANNGYHCLKGIDFYLLS